jgi:signal transduction histidine kinase
VDLATLTPRRTRRLGAAVVVLGVGVVAVMLPRIFGLSAGNLRPEALATAVCAGVLGVVGWAVAGAMRRTAVRDERRRLAREIHDGLAQDLAFIVRETMRLEPSLHRDRIRDAADRALGESRLAMQALAAAERPLPALLRDAAESVAVRAGATVEVDGAGDGGLSADARRALMRIVREASSNGVRHGGARSIALRYDAGRPFTLCIADDGHGFDPAAERAPTAFGLDSMRERAEALGGRLDVRSAPGHGTQIEVSIP